MCLAVLAATAIDAAAAAPVKIAAVAEGPIKVSVRDDAKELRRTFRLVPDAVPTAKVSRVRLAACTDPDAQACTGVAITGTCAAGCTVTATEPGEVTVVVPTPAPGAYTGSLEIVYVVEEKPAGEGKVEVIEAVLATTLEVTRPAPAVTAIELLVGARAAEVERLPAENATAVFRFPLQDKDGKPYAVDQLVVGPVVRKSGTDDVQTGARVLAWYLEDGGKRTAVPSGGKLPATARELVVEVRGIDRAGKFEGKLRLLSANRTPQEVTYAVTARDGVWTAILWIVLGVMISYGVQWWVGRFRGRVVQRGTITRLRELLLARPVGAERDRRLRDALVADCDARLDELAEAALADADLKRLVRRVDLAGTLAETGRTVEKLPLAARTEPRKKLDAHAATLGKRAVTDEELTAIDNELATLATVGVRRAALAELLTAVDDAVAQARVALPAAQQDRLTARVEPALREAHLASDRGDLDALDRALATSRLELARTEAAALADRFPEAMPEPFTDADAYARLRRQVLALTSAVERSDDPDEASRLCDEALAVAAPATCTATAAFCRRELPGAPADVVARLETLAGEAMAARTLPPAEAMAAADRVLREATTVRAGPTPMTVGAGGDAAPARSGLPLPSLPSLRELFTDRPSARAVRGAIAVGDAAVLVGLIILAVATGLRLLWASSATWGGWTDWLTALLWGGGLHTVGNDTFKGLAGLKKDLGKVE